MAFMEKKLFLDQMDFISKASVFHHAVWCYKLGNLMQSFIDGKNMAALWSISDWENQVNGLFDPDPDGITFTVVS